MRTPPKTSKVFHVKHFATKMTAKMFHVEHIAPYARLGLYSGRLNGRKLRQADTR